jgi:hypothetical protein
MRTIRLTVALGALALATGGAANAAAPSLRFLDLTPAKVRGTSFVPREQVKLTLRAGTDIRTRTVRATGAGAFIVDFGRLREQDRCSGSIAVTAVGARGDRAAYKLPGMACPTMASGPFR